jgi:hypothetical protein
MQVSWLLELAWFRNRCGARWLSGCSCGGGVDLGHELAVGGTGGTEVLVASVELEPQVGDLLLLKGSKISP